MPEREPVLESYQRIPLELRVLPQWVNWSPNEGKKVPINPATLGNAGVTWENSWAGYELAIQSASLHGLGIGFVLTERDPYTCIDLDKCVSADRQVDDRTRSILDLLSGWVELSPSGTGLHIWVKNDIPVNRRTKGIEIYSSKRWMTITGRSNANGPSEIPMRTDEVAVLLDAHFTRPKRKVDVRPMNLDDQEVWDRLFSSSNGDFYRSLQAGDVSVCYGDHSRAVIMLANQLALLTDFDAGRMKNLLYQTGLVREKWDEKRSNITWIDYQIQDAIRYMAGRES